jgi:hypothetical protein
MLKELNGIAGGLLGLHGYPVQPFSWGAQAESKPAAEPVNVPRAKPRDPAPKARKPASVATALHC